MRIIRALALFLALFAAVLVPTEPASATVFDNSEHDTAWYTNGQVYAVDLSGDVVYFGGNFSSAKSPDGDGHPAGNVGAISRQSGRVHEAFDVETDGLVRAIESDGTRVWIGGDFTMVNGEYHPHLVAVDARTGAIDRTFVGVPNRPVHSISHAGGRLWVSGAFWRVNDTRQKRIASLDPVTGAVDPGFAAESNSIVRTVELSNDGSFLVAGGGFVNIGGQDRRALAKLDPATGNALPSNFPADLSPVLGVATNDADSRIFVAFGGSQGGGLFGWNNRVAAFDADNSYNYWWRRPDGDTQAIGYHDGYVYFGHHDPFEGDETVRMLRITDDGILDDGWRPSIDSRRGVLALDVNSDGLVAGGKFKNVNDSYRKGLALWASAGAGVGGNVDLISDGSAWKWDATPQGDASWASTSYNDDAWNAGAAQLGFGDGDESTTVPIGATSYYFRREFTASGPTSTIDLSMIRDDGAVVYLNGVEILRSNMPTGTITSSTLATEALGSATENMWNDFTLSGSGLLSGTNVLAVEIHQATTTSSDVSFDLQLEAPAPAGANVVNPDFIDPSAPTGLTLTKNNGNVVKLTWNDDGTDDRFVAGYRIYRNGVFVKEVGEGAYNDWTPIGGATASYEIRTLDSGGNESAPASVVVAVL